MVSLNSQQNRPLGVSVLAVFVAGDGLLMLLPALLYILVLPLFIFATWNVVSALMSFIIAFGLWNLKPWSWKLAIGWYLISIPLNLAFLSRFLQMSIAEVLSEFYISFVISGLVSLYAYSKREFFVN